MNKKLLVIAGPTAVGKTSVGINIAQKIGGEIISADSMQVYKGLDIGTAKPTLEEQDAARHRMIDVCSPDSHYSVAEYVLAAEKEIEDVLSKGLIPIVVGGTGLYIDNLIYKNDFGECKFDPLVREKLNERAEREGGNALLRELSEIDIETARRLHQNDVRRIVRALEIFYSTGKTQSSFIKESRKNSPYEVLYVVLTTSDREVLYSRINKRVDVMINNGLLNEAENVIKSPWYSGSTASQAIGYKEFEPFFNNTKPLEECITLLKQHSRNYAKRQLTWFRGKKEAVFINVDKEEKIVEKIIDLLELKGD